MNATATVVAQRQRYSTDPRSTVIHDTETNALVAQNGRLFAATDQWEYPGAHAYGQVLVKNGPNGPWSVFEQTQGLRVQALDSLSIPANQGEASGRSLLVTQAQLGTRSVVQWASDGATAFASTDAYTLSPGAVVRAFGAHDADGQWAVYAGVDPTGILRGVWSARSQTLVFNPVPELDVASGAPGVPAQKVTGFADCGGSLYATIDTTLYRRNDGTLPDGVARWVPVYQEPPVGMHNSGLRGITCTSHEGEPALLVSTEGDGDVYRLEHLPSGVIDASASTVPGASVQRLSPILEFAPVPAIRRMLADEGTSVPASGRGSIVYVIAAYNNGSFDDVRLDGTEHQLFGFEWGYAGACPPTRTCGPVASGLVHFDAAACFAIRTDTASAPTFGIRCLSGPDFTPSGRVGKPIQNGQAFVSIRTIVTSPFDDDHLYYGGYDCDFYPADGTAWVATSTVDALHLSPAGKERA